jgi:hypothetical protein
MAADDAAERAGRVATLMSRFTGARRGPVVNNRIAPEDVTIVVLNWKRSDETIRCLESLAAANLRGASVLVVDNGSRDGSVETILQRFPEQAIVTLPVNRGYSGGNNAGILAAIENGAKAVLLLNNDTQVAADFLDPLLWVLNGDVKAAAASSAVLRADVPELLESAYLEIYWGHGIIRHYGVNKLPGEGFDYVREVGVVVGCSVLLSVDAVNAIGPLDESYFAYHEECRSNSSPPCSARSRRSRSAPGATARPSRSTVPTRTASRTHRGPRCGGSCSTFPTCCCVPSRATSAVRGTKDAWRRSASTCAGCGTAFSIVRCRWNASGCDDPEAYPVAWVSVSLPRSVVRAFFTAEDAEGAEDAGSTRTYAPNVRTGLFAGVGLVGTKTPASASSAVKKTGARHRLTARCRLAKSR